MLKTKILIVEDETIVALEIKSVLKKLGYEVTNTVTNHHDALKSVQTNKPDMILMDIHLENSKDGIQTAQDIQKTVAIPILYLTAFSDDETIDRAIQTNPVGYLLKPFKREELKSTIRLGLHKINPENQSNIDENFKNLGLGYYYNLKEGNLYYKNMPIRLSPKENQLLKVLIDARGNIVPFDDLEHLIWPDKQIHESSLRTLIYRVRSKLEYKLIETIPSFGCKLIPLS